MLAARSSGGGVQPPHIHRKHSVASLSGTKRNSPEKRNASAGKVQSQARNKASLIREIETTWYLKMFGLGKEETVAHKTGMPYRNLGKSGLRVSCLGLGTWVTFGGQITDEISEFTSWLEIMTQR